MSLTVGHLCLIAWRSAREKAARQVRPPLRPNLGLLDLCRTDSPLLSTKQPEKKVASPTRVMSPRT